MFPLWILGILVLVLVFLIVWSILAHRRYEKWRDAQIAEATVWLEWLEVFDEDEVQLAFIDRDESFYIPPNRTIH